MDLAELAEVVQDFAETMTVDGEPKGGQTSTPLDLLLQYAQEPARCKSTDDGNGHQRPSMAINGAAALFVFEW